MVEKWTKTSRERNCRLFVNLLKKTMALEILKPDLPNMPDEVIEVWLVPHYQRFGWPPSANRDWRYIFGLDRPFEYFQSMTWEKTEIELTPSALTRSAFQTIIGLVQTHYFGQLTPYSGMSDSKERLDRCVDYLKEHGTYPKPVILLSTPEGYEILDGNHRVTAFFYLYGYFNTPNCDQAVPCLEVKQEQPFWAGTPSA
ncbi:MAG: ParB N-terminal domain-containing protein [Parvibaculum sp.]|nr:ParB N-terminal domain-containing protein [Parvibaculum sp.]